MLTTINGIKTHYYIINKSAPETLIILHGWKSASKFWLPFSKLLSKKIRIILLDLPGFGKTHQLSKPEIPLYTEFIHTFITKQKLTNYSISGHSFGGLLALDYAIKYPGDLKSLILISPAILKEKITEIKKKIALAEKIAPSLPTIKNNHLEKYLGLFTPRYSKNSSIYRQTVLKNTALYDLKPKLSQVTVPTHIIWSQFDPILPNIGEYLKNKIKECYLHTVSHPGHLLFLTHPEVLASIINGALSTNKN